MSVDNITKLREVELELLEAFISVCQKHDLNWYIMFGSLLGAVRNEGFLTWDDDIDVCMPLADYQKLCENKHWFDERYFLQTPLNEGMQNIAKLRKNGTTAFGQSLLDCLRRGGHHGIPLDIVPIVKVNGTNSCHTPSLINEKKKKAIYLDSWFGQPQIGKFENMNVNLPSNPRKILKAVYDDWSWPNGAELCNPSFWFFDTENSYEIYFKKYTGMLENIEDKKIYLFGAADSMSIWLKRFGLRDQVVCTFDNDSNKWGEFFDGVLIRNPIDLPEFIDDYSRVIIVSLWHHEIGKQLENMGILDYYVFLDYYYDFDYEGTKIIRED